MILKIFCLNIDILNSFNQPVLFLYDYSALSLGRPSGKEINHAFHILHTYYSVFCLKFKMSVTAQKASRQLLRVFNCFYITHLLLTEMKE